MPGRRNQTGYTLLELMVVVVLIGVMAALAVPGLTRGLRERRKARAAHDVVRTFQSARRQSIANGRAHLVRYAQGGDTSRGTLEIFRGDSHRCNNNDWADMTADACADNLRCAQHESFHPSGFESAGSTMQLRLTTVGLGQTIDICYDGTGVMWWRNGTTGMFADVPYISDADQVLGAFTFTISALVSGTDPGVVRRIVVPFGGEARFVR